jgi:hypothetical protein
VNRSVESILRRLIAKSFPELKRLRIAIEFGELDPETCFFYYEQAGRFQITVSNDLQRAPRPVLEGGIAHELCHLVHDTRLHPYQRALALERYTRSAIYRMRDERKTELRQLASGYGPQLLAFLSYAKTLGFHFTRRHGLLRSEIALRLRKHTAAPSGYNQEWV